MEGIPMLLCGDFRQVLPVVKNGTRPQIVEASLKKSYLWPHITVKHLSTNMRAFLSGDETAADFSALLLSIGDGAIPPVELPDTIEIPTELCQKANDLEQLKVKVFPNLAGNGSSMDWLAERAIISPLNDNVNKLNSWLMSEFPGEERIYKSVDTAMNDNEAVLYPMELLNSIDLPGILPHELKLKIGAPIIILRSLDPPKTTNGTRCVITRLHNNVLEAKISCGPYKGETVLLPRIPLIPTDSALPFDFKRLQYPVKPAFALTINKSQGQTFKIIGVDLSEPCFTHGMFYVAASRTGCPENLIMLVKDNRTRNVVYPEALQ